MYQASATAGGAVASAGLPAPAGHSGQASSGGGAAAQAAPSPPKAVRQTSATMSVQEKQLAGLLKRQVSSHHASVLLSPHPVQLK